MLTLQLHLGPDQSLIDRLHVSKGCLVFRVLDKWSQMWTSNALSIWFANVKL